MIFLNQNQCFGLISMATKKATDLSVKIFDLLDTDLIEPIPPDEGMQLYELSDKGKSVVKSFMQSNANEVFQLRWKWD